jgi:hypothetical protein
MGAIRAHAQRRNRRLAGPVRVHDRYPQASPPLQGALLLWPIALISTWIWISVIGSKADEVCPCVEIFSSTLS